jgi:TP53 regulating kinase-like protein
LTLDASLTKTRVSGEARALLKCLRYIFFWLGLVFLYLYRLVCRSGVNVPGLRYVDATEGLLGIEWIEGKSIKYLLPSGAEEELHEDEDNDLDDAPLLATDEDPLKEFGISVGMSYFSRMTVTYAYYHIYS